MDVHTLLPAVKHYSWGSKSYIPQLLGISNPKGLAYAELWLGTHPDGMSLAASGGMPESLQGLISKDPEAWLGRGITSSELPFLLKILGIESPLSIQCHPNSRQAREGFQWEERKGIPREDERRSYRDANHKPELLCALTEFTALCGFRSLEEINRLVSPIYQGSLQEISDTKELMSTTLSFQEEQVHAWVKQLKDEKGEAYELLRKLYRIYGPDPGILSPLYMQIVTLQPGEAIYLAPGILHAYVQGMGLELMASSDNVIRGGLTGKYIDRSELERVAVFSSTPVARITPVHDARGGGMFYPVEIDDFLLERLNSGTFSREGRDMLEIGIILSGSVEILSPQGGRYTAGKGGAFAIPAAMDEYTLMCTGEIAIARRGGTP